MLYDTLRLQLRRYFNLGCWLGLSSKCLGWLISCWGFIAAGARKIYPSTGVKCEDLGFARVPHGWCLGVAVVPRFRPFRPQEHLLDDADMILNHDTSLLLSKKFKSNKQKRYLPWVFSTYTGAHCYNLFRVFHPWNTNHSGGLVAGDKHYPPRTAHAKSLQTTLGWW